MIAIRRSMVKKERNNVITNGAQMKRLVRVADPVLISRVMEGQAL